MRPTIDLKPSDNWSFRFRPYFKMPMPWEWQSTVSSGEVQNIREDYRIDLESSITIGLDDYIDTQNKNVDFILKYNMFYDNAPARLYVPDPQSSTPVLFSAPRRHSQFSFNFRVEF
ncbi:MAG: hypothetical protein IPO65_04465 [Saprospiraceae bacterium]|nr:hypothetical protein [Saprospiraceae bacterium]